ncbi:hypothetical protein LIER_12169 [Lithospermum erythrorhizon]|uniref:Uncharacterized protein n=1 Tax=Lithospermum erythrorhizon TaxID=34254 RepID=A0AAV3PUS5_LITER
MAGSHWGKEISSLQGSGDHRKGLFSTASGKVLKAYLSILGASGLLSTSDTFSTSIQYLSTFGALSTSGANLEDLIFYLFDVYAEFKSM